MLFLVNINPLHLNKSPDKTFLSALALQIVLAIALEFEFELVWLDCASTRPFHTLVNINPPSFHTLANRLLQTALSTYLNCSDI